MRATRRSSNETASGKVLLLARLHSSLAALTESEQKVAAVVRRDPQAVVYSSVTELARDVFSEASSHDAPAEAPGPPGADLLQRATEENRRVIVGTYGLIDTEAFTRAVELLGNAGQIHFYGAGHSGITAEDARYRFWRLGFLAFAFADPHFQLMAAATPGPEDVAVGLSVSGSTRDTVECLATAMGRGTSSIAPALRRLRSPGWPTWCW